MNMNLGPVLDTVPGAAAASANPPIGAFGREYGYVPEGVARHATAFARGMADAGVVTSAKHFPGLGRVRANPDVSAGVTDPVTGPHGPVPRAVPHRDRGGGARRDDVDGVLPAPRPGPTRRRSRRTVVGGLLRGDLGFRGVVVSDDLGIARQVARWPAGDRAVRFLARRRRPRADGRPRDAAGHAARRPRPHAHLPGVPRPRRAGRAAGAADQAGPRAAALTAGAGRAAVWATGLTGVRALVGDTRVTYSRYMSAPHPTPAGGPVVEGPPDPEHDPTASYALEPGVRRAR